MFEQKIYINTQPYNDKLYIMFGNKFARLCEITDLVNIPTAICLSNKLINDIFYQDEARKDRMRYLMEELKATAANELFEVYNEIENIAKTFYIDTQIKKELRQVLEKYFAKIVSFPVAVRSSASHEDSSECSFAGVYNSYLNIDSLDAIIDCIEKVIKQYFSFSAISLRIRRGIFSEKIELAIIIQSMVKSKISGVCFSKFKNEKNYIEWVNGYGEDLVSGNKVANKFKGVVPNELNPELCETLFNVQGAVEKVKDYLGYEIDVEWAWDGNTIFFVQVRPITVDLYNTVEESIFLYDKMYFEKRLEENRMIYDCNEVYIKYMKKRARYYALAAANEIDSLPGYVVTFNVRGLKNCGEKAIGEMFGKSLNTKVVVDVSPNIRQNIMDIKNVRQYLENLFQKNEIQLHSVIIRQFIDGEFGCISSMQGEKTVVLEYSRDGLLAMNRGLASVNRIFLEFNNKKDVTEEIRADNIQLILKFMKALKMFGKKYLVEWIIFKGKVYFADYSVEQENENILEQNSEITSIVAGNITGNIYWIPDGVLLEKLSIGPGVSIDGVSNNIKESGYIEKIIGELKKFNGKVVICVKKPYAVLTVFFNYVQGFIFEQGSLLCHLAIMLRESGKTAYICPDIVQITKGKKYITVIDEQIITKEG